MEAGLNTSVTIPEIAGELHIRLHKSSHQMPGDSTVSSPRDFGP